MGARYATDYLKAHIGLINFDVSIKEKKNGTRGLDVKVKEFFWTRNKWYLIPNRKYKW